MVDDEEGIVNHLSCDTIQNVAIPSLMNFDVLSKNDRICIETFTQTTENDTFMGKTGLLIKHDWSWFYIFMQILNSILTCFVIVSTHERSSYVLDTNITCATMNLDWTNILCSFVLFAVGFITSSLFYAIGYQDDSNSGIDDFRLMNCTDVFYDAILPDETMCDHVALDDQTTDAFLSRNIVSDVSNCNDEIAPSVSGVPEHINHVPDIDLMKIDRKLVEVRNCLHDTLPFISTACRINQPSASFSKFGLTRLNNSIIHDNGLCKSKYFFVHILDGDDTQDDVFSLLTERISTALSGIPFICIVIGSSGSGKTYTLTGKSVLNCESDGDYGVLGRALKYCLNKIDDKIRLIATALEISPTESVDLLSGKRIGSNDAVVHDNLVSKIIKRESDIHSLIIQLRNNRCTTPTLRWPLF